ncbi:MAG TPA: hypothetical protein P5572_00340 [Phycisphaerae bacterium]|nr:hypothetical protein [Phycisphaerales bacterium]HRX83446.1 hypothetical protein [Phycisphaerae bacterium]
MPKKRRHRRRTVWIVRTALGVGGVLIVGLLGLWLALERVPGWYAPLEVAQAELPRVRNSLPNTYQSLNDAALADEPFDFSISDRTVTEWVVARGELYPEARTWLPDWLRDPVVHFEDGRCVVGARIDYRGWQTILGIHLEFAVADDFVTARVDKLTAGAVAIPLSRLAGPLADLLDERRVDVSLMPDPVADVVRRLRAEGVEHLIEEGVRWPNRFELRNARRVVKVRSITCADGMLTARVEPRR